MEGEKGGGYGEYMEREQEKRESFAMKGERERERERSFVERRSVRYNPNIRSYKSLIVTRGMPTPRWDRVRN